MTTAEVPEFHALVKELSAPTVLLGLLNGAVDQFQDVRARAREHSSELWPVLVKECLKAGDSLADDRRLVFEIGRIEEEWNSNPELNRLLTRHVSALSQIARPLGNPPHLVILMLNEDIKIAMKDAGIIHPVIEAMKQQSSRMPGTWTADVHQLLDFGFYQITGLTSPSQMEDPATARKARKKLNDEVKSLKRIITREDPRWPVAEWLLAKVMGVDAEQIAKWRDREEETIRHSIQRASRMLGVKVGRGRPSRRKLPVEIWPALEFGQS